MRHEWTDERPCWVDGEIGVRIDEDDSLNGLLSFQLAKGWPFQSARTGGEAIELPLERYVLCREILRLAARVRELETPGEPPG